MMADLLTFEFVCKLSELPSGSKKCVELPTSHRSVMLLNIRGQVFCMDQACYHHGGPLVNGDIEEMGGKTTIKCPWHAYHIAVETGEGLYKGVDMAMTPSGRLQPSSPRLKSKGVKQRTHFVELRNDGQDIYVADSSAIPGASMIESDVYAFRTANIPEAAKNGEVRIHSRFE
ncbi:Rieske domain-containing protein [Phytophthora cinnamomi]|uniref:Rieske domain-containing protein n=1 Tax=Phytophthora cinnamomi TaxID=4785 RepID=UPI00355AC12F|nr:Rieske domain-containing protein [Phytophthora cinnamomi]